MGKTTGVGAVVAAGDPDVLLFSPPLQDGDPWRPAHTCREMASQAPVPEAVPAACPAEFKHVSHAAAGTGTSFGVGAAGFPQAGAGFTRFFG